MEKGKGVSRRKAVFAINGVLLAKALPSQWVKPVVGAVLLPAHAQTSPQCLVGSWALRDTSPDENDPGHPLILNADGTGVYDGDNSVTWSSGVGTVTMITIAFNQSTARLKGSVRSDCNSMSGGWENAVTNSSGSWEANRTTTSTQNYSSSPDATAFR